MKVAVVLLSCLAFAASSRRPYPSRYPSSGGGFPGRGSVIVFPDEVKGGGGSGGHVHPGVGVGNIYPPPVGHGGEPLVTSHCPRAISKDVHGTFLGHNYHFSWCADGGQRYTWEAARDYCTRLGPGWYPVAIESRDEDNYIIDIVGSLQDGT
ncbi:hypothetical protein E2C01_017271 [Portunus trituberculatus]|uniref:C-type lectin domain-containing protein n=1 Tax=Portunus trituberculatus TaxID=210409 RepID=A0A5B7DSF0_PORTR|nr:hypothetical protein [Portunus trituberculatus]